MSRVDCLLPSDGLQYMWPCVCSMWRLASLWLCPASPGLAALGQILVSLVDPQVTQLAFRWKVLLSAFVDPVVLKKLILSGCR